MGPSMGSESMLSDRQHSSVSSVGWQGNRNRGDERAKEKRHTVSLGIESHRRGCRYSRSYFPVY